MPKGPGVKYIVAARNLGQLAFDIPAGLAVSRWGDAIAMVLGTLLVGVAALGAALSPSPMVLGLLMFFMGGGWAFWQLARLAYVAGNRPPNLGSNIIVGSPVFDTTTFTVFGNFYGDVARTYHVTHSLDRARALLTRATLQYPAQQRTMSA